MSKLCTIYVAHMIGGPVRGENWTIKMEYIGKNNKLTQLNLYKVREVSQKNYYLYVFAIFDECGNWYMSKTGMANRYKIASQTTFLKQSFFSLCVERTECKTFGNEI